MIISQSSSSTGTLSCPEGGGTCASVNRTEACPRSSTLFKRGLIGTLTLGLLLFPAAKNSRATSLHASLAFAQSSQSQSEADEARREREEAQRERQRQREKEQHEREQEKKDREQERLDRLQELYDDGRENLDDEQYEKAVGKFSQLAQMNGPQTDAALYWKAYAQNREGKKDAALASIVDLKKRFPQSRWKKDGEALEIEVRSSTGGKPNPEAQSDEELKLLALQGLMNSDPEKAIPLVEKILNGTSSPRVKSKALFVLAQNGSPQSQEMIAKIAKGQSNPDLQRKAVEYLAIFGGKRAGKTLAEIYASTTDAGVKQAVIKSYIISGDKEQLAALAKSEPHAELRKAAIRNLGIV